MRTSSLWEVERERNSGTLAWVHRSPFQALSGRHVLCWRVYFEVVAIVGMANLGMFIRN